MKIIAALLLAVAACSGKSSDTIIANTAAGDITLTGRVVDQAEALPNSTEAGLATRLATLENQTSDQVVVVTLPTLNGATIESVALALGRGWTIGRADLDNGVILLVVPSERKVRIEVGYGLEGLLTDERAATIVRRMLPVFRSGDLPGGIDIGVKEITDVLGSDTRRPRYRSEARKKFAA